MVLKLAPITAPTLLEPLMQRHAVQPLVAHLLHLRGVDAETSLEPTLEPAPLPNLTAAAELLAHHIRDGNRITLHGDYDADGLTGTAILQAGLMALGSAPVRTAIPNRLREGYGLARGRVDEIAAKTDLLVTIDCGIANLEEVAAYRARGVDVLVTDHHEPKATLPDALIVHPTAIERRPDFDLTGAGVAYHLLWALRRELGAGETAPGVNEAFLAAIGTIADVADATPANRALIQHGLREVQQRGGQLRAGLKHLASYLGSPAKASDIGFQIAPRINAAGRLGRNDDALALLTTESETRAAALAELLDHLNDERRRLQRTAADQADARVEPDCAAIVLDDPAWHAGVIGIAAAKLCERYGKPTFLSSGGKGSVRMPPGISATAALGTAHDLLASYGGHAAAAGFTVALENHAAFAERIEAFTREHAPPVPTLLADALLAAGDASETLLNELHVLEPHGRGNPEPRFALVAPLQDVKVIGQDRTHLALRLVRPDAPTRGVAWSQAHLAASVSAGAPTAVLANLTINEFRGKRTIEFRADTFAPHQALEGETPDEGTTPDGAGETPDVTRGSEADAPAGATVVRDLPAGDPHATLSALEAAHGNGAPVHYALAASELERLEGHALAENGDATLATRPLIRWYVAAWRREGDPPQHPLADRLKRILGEVELVDAGGHLAIAPRNLYDSATLRRDELARYRLGQFVQHYRHAHAHVFAQAARLLLSPS